MKRRITSFMLTIGLMVGVGLFLVPAPAYAQEAPAAPAADANNGAGGGTGINVFQNCNGGDQGGICGANKQGDFEKLMKNIINTILFVLGMIAVIMIIVGGIRYVTSNGESAQVQAAKNTVLYSVVGLVIAILSYAIVNFVLDAFSNK